MSNLALTIIVSVAGNCFDIFYDKVALDLAESTGSFAGQIIAFMMLIAVLIFWKKKIKKCPLERI